MKRIVYLCLPNYQLKCWCWKRGDGQDCGVDPDAPKRKPPAPPAPAPGQEA
jgi:hypothetical protein